MKKLLFLFLAVLMLTGLSGCEEPEQKAIESIYVSHVTAIGLNNEWFSIDFDKKQMTSQYNEEAALEGAVPGKIITVDLQEDKIETFFKESARLKFTRWEDEYVYAISDGHQWSIRITFADKTQKYIRGSNNYPNNWNEMGKALKELTGADVLVYGRGMDYTDALYYMDGINPPDNFLRPQSDWNEFLCYESYWFY